MLTAGSWHISESSRNSNMRHAAPKRHTNHIDRMPFLCAGLRYCSYMAYFFGEIPTAFVNAFKKLL